MTDSFGTRMEYSSASEIEEDQEPRTPVPELQQSKRSADSSGVPRSTAPATAPMSVSKAGFGKNKGGKRKVPERSDDDTETLLQQLAEQQRHNSRIQGNIENLLSQDQLSTTAAWGAWMGSLANRIDPRLHRQMYKDAINMMMDFVDSSRLLPPLQAPLPAVQQPTQQQLQPNPQTAPQQEPPQFYVDQQPGMSYQQPAASYDDQQPTTSYVDMIAPPPTQPPMYDRGHQSDTGTSVPQAYLGSWNTEMPTSGQSTASASFPSNMPPRPASTPNMSQTSIRNISGLSDVFNAMNTPNVQDKSPSQPQGGPNSHGSF